jgi:hypothetical protein
MALKTGDSGLDFNSWITPPPPSPQAATAHLPCTSELTTQIVSLSLWLAFLLLIFDIENVYLWLIILCPSMGRFVHGKRRPWDASSMGSVVHGKRRPWDASSMGRVVHGKRRPLEASFMGRIVQGTEHQRLFGRGHTGRGRNNIAPFHL